MLVGGLAGYFGGWLDAVLMRLVEVIMTIPDIFFAGGAGGSAASHVVQYPALFADYPHHLICPLDGTGTGGAGAGVVIAIANLCNRFQSDGRSTVLHHRAPHLASDCDLRHYFSHPGDPQFYCGRGGAQLNWTGHSTA